MSVVRREVASIVFADPTGDENFHVLKAPGDDSLTVEAAYVVSLDGVSSSTADYTEISLMNGGTSGTATTVISGTAGGTGGFTADSPVDLSVTDGSGKLDSGEYLVAKYAETGSPTGGDYSIIVEYVHGVGASAAS